MPFEGLTQGIQAAGSMFDMYNAPQLNQLNLLQQQAKLEQLRGLDPVSQQRIAESQANIDLAGSKEQRLQKAQESEMQQKSAELLGAISYSLRQIKDPNERLEKAMSFAKLLRLPEDIVTTENIEASAKLYEQSLKPTQKLGRVFQAVDDQGNLVFAQADQSGNIKIAEGITPTDFESQRLQLQKEIAEGKLELQEQKAESEKKTKETKEKVDTSQLTGQLAQIDSLINDPNFSGAVGLLDQVTGYIGSKFGTNEGVVNRRAKRLLSSSVAKIAKSLGANPTDKDIVLLKETQPSMSDQPIVWQDWYKNDLMPVISARLRAMGQEEFSSGSGEMSKKDRMNQLKRELNL